MKQIMRRSTKIEATRGEKVYQAITGSILFILLVCCMYPLIYVLGASFMTEAEWIDRGGVFLFPHNPTFEAYKEVLSKPDLYKAIGVSILRTVVGPVCATFCNMIFGYALTIKDFWGKRTLSFIVFFTMVFGGGTIPAYLVRDYTGLLNNFLVYVLPGLLSGWTALLFKQTFAGTPESLVEAAKIDGASEFDILIKIMVPCSKATIAVMLFMAMVGAWNSWFDAFLYIDSNNTDLIPLQLYLKNYFSFSSISGTAAIMNAEAKKMVVAVVGIMPIMITYPFFLKHFTKGVYLGAVKE